MAVYENFMTIDKDKVLDALNKVAVDDESMKVERSKGNRLLIAR